MLSFALLLDQLAIKSKPFSSVFKDHYDFITRNTFMFTFMDVTDILSFFIISAKTKEQLSKLLKSRTLISTCFIAQFLISNSLRTNYDIDK